MTQSINWYATLLCFNRSLCLCFLTVFFTVEIVACGQAKNSIRNETTFPALGVQVQIIAYVDRDENFGLLCSKIKHEIGRLNLIFSNYRNDSEIEKLSVVAPESRKVSSELWEVAELSGQVFAQSKGAFDPTIGPVSKVWAWARKRNRLPNQEAVKLAIKNVGWPLHVKMENQQIGLSSPDVKLDFGGVAKGYIADQIVKLASNEGVKSILVDVGGDIAMGNPPPNQTGWNVAIEMTAGEKQLLRLSNCGVATSGDAEQRIVKDGVRYSHIIDPRSGNAVTHSYLVTVVAENCATADAFASALSVLNIDDGIELVNRLPGIEARIESSARPHMIKRSDRFDEGIR